MPGGSSRPQPSLRPGGGEEFHLLRYNSYLWDCNDLWGAAKRINAFLDKEEPAASSAITLGAETAPDQVMMQVN